MERGPKDSRVAQSLKSTGGRVGNDSLCTTTGAGIVKLRRDAGQKSLGASILGVFLPFVSILAKARGLELRHSKASVSSKNPKGRCSAFPTRPYAFPMRLHGPCKHTETFVPAQMPKKSAIH